MPPVIPPNIGNEGLNDLLSGTENPAKNVIRKGLEISDEISPNDIPLIQNNLDNSNEDLQKINHSKKRFRNLQASGDNDPNNIVNLNSSANIVNNIDFPQSNGSVFGMIDQIIEEKNRLFQGEEEDKKEIDQPKHVNIINENNMHDDYAEPDEEMDLGDYLDPARIRELRKRPDYSLGFRKPVKPVDLNISNSNIEDALNEDSGDEEKKEPARKDRKKQSKKNAPKEKAGLGDTYALDEDMVPAPRSKKIGKSWRNKKQSKEAPAIPKEITWKKTERRRKHRP